MLHKINTADDACATRDGDHININIARPSWDSVFDDRQ
jgi:hypothetical protein